jgi:hypothetical protein
MLRIPNVESFRSMLDASDLLTFKQFAQEYPAFPMNRLRPLPTGQTPLCHCPRCQASEVAAPAPGHSR